MKMLHSFPLLFILFAGCSSAPFTDYSENTELIQQGAGYDVKLECDLKKLPDAEEHMPDVEIHWYFKQCSDNLDENNGGTVPCDDYYESDWTKLPEQSFNQPTILLHNVTENYSGLYKCTQRSQQKEGSAVDKELNIIRMFRLEVKRDVSEDAPQFVDTQPIDQTASLGSQVVFQCRVHDADYPSVMWFRRIGPVILQQLQPRGDYVRHGDFYYERLVTPREKLIEKDVYLSKLMLANIREQDEGYYACVAISYRGYRVREAYLSVVLTNELNDVASHADYWSEYSEMDELQKSPQEFWLLFLMPLGLVLLPVCLLCGWCLLRKCRNKEEILETAIGPSKGYGDLEVIAAMPLRGHHER